MIPIKVYEYNGIKYIDNNEFRKVFKNVSFPKNITDQMLMSKGVIIREEVEIETFESRKNKKFLDAKSITNILEVINDLNESCQLKITNYYPICFCKNLLHRMPIKGTLYILLL